MELNNIEQLVQKYLEATTSIAEEKKLQLYFSSEKVAPHLKQYQYLFQYFNQAKNETSSREIPLKPRKNYLKWSSIAASFILAIGFVTYINNQQKQNQQEALQAYYQTKAALQLVSGNLNTGASKITHLKTFETTKQQIFKSNH